MKIKKRPYVRPEIKEETYILTVSAWATQTNTSVRVSETSRKTASTSVRFANTSRRLYS